MATPHVVGVVSLMLSVNPSLTPAQVTTMLQSTATPFPAAAPARRRSCGAGIVNAAAAVAAANGGGGGTPAPGAFGKTSPADLASIAGTSTDADVGRELGRRELLVLRRHGQQRRRVTRSWQSAGAATSASRVRPRGGHDVLLAGAGVERHRRHARGRRHLVDVRDPGRADAAGSVLEDVSDERPAEPEAADHAQVGDELGGDVVRVVRLARRAAPARRGTRRPRPRPRSRASRRRRRITGRCEPSTASARPTRTAAPGGASGRSRSRVHPGARLRGEASASPRGFARASARSRRSACSPWCRRSTSRPSPSRSSGMPPRPRV